MEEKKRDKDVKKCPWLNSKPGGHKVGALAHCIKDILSISGIYSGFKRKDLSCSFEESKSNISGFKLNWIITDMFSFLMFGLQFSDSTVVTASGVRTYIFHVAAQPHGFSAA